MSKFLEAVRRLFSRKGNTEQQQSENDVQKAPPRAPRMYDEVTMGKGGEGPTVQDETEANDVQTVKRVPRPYDEVDVDDKKEGGGVQVK